MKQLTLIAIACFVLSCGGRKTEMDYQDYSRWLAGNEALKKEKKSKIVDMSVIFLPGDLLAYRNAEIDDNYSGLDSLRAVFNNTLTFEISLTASDPAVNLLWYGNQDYPAYEQRMHRLSFRSEDFFRVSMDGVERSPVLTHFEGYNELSNKIVFHVVFDRGDMVLTDPSDKVKLTFEDPFWGSGVNHFTFRKKDLIDIPKLIFG